MAWVAPGAIELTRDSRRDVQEYVSGRGGGKRNAGLLPGIIVWGWGPA